MATIITSRTSAGRMNAELLNLESELARENEAAQAEGAAIEAEHAAVEAERAAYLDRERRATELRAEISDLRAADAAAHLVVVQAGHDTGPVGQSLAAHCADAHLEASAGKLSGIAASRAAFRRILGLTPPPVALWSTSGSVTHFVSFGGLTWSVYLGSGDPDLLLVSLTGVPGGPGGNHAIASPADFGAILASYPSVAQHVAAATKPGSGA